MLFWFKEIEGLIVAFLLACVRQTRVQNIIKFADTNSLRGKGTVTAINRIVNRICVFLKISDEDSSQLVLISSS